MDKSKLRRSAKAIAKAKEEIPYTLEGELKMIIKVVGGGKDENLTMAELDIEFEATCGDYTLEDMKKVEPEMYVKMGPTAALISEVFNGLNSPEGVSLESAVRRAKGRQEHAEAINSLRELLDLVDVIGLSVAKTGGSA